jgi:hypothetical protein
MIVAVNKELACQKLDRIGKKLNVIYYKKKIPIKPILMHLKIKEEPLIKSQITSLQNKEISISEPVVEAKDLAEKLGVLETAAKKILQQKEIDGYIRLHDMLIKEETLHKIKNELENTLIQRQLTLKEASAIIEDLGGKRPTTILDTLGYKVKWHGIDPNSAIIRKMK